MSRIFCARGFRLPLGKKTYVMGILNVTPDSFSDGGRWNTPEKALEHALRMKAEGADIIDVGAQSSRPGFVPVPAAVELERLEPVLRALRGRVDLPVSVDTFYPEVAREAARQGADIINDITGFDDGAMIEAAAQAGCGCIVMHHAAVEPEKDTAETVRSFFEERVPHLLAAGVNPQSICLDPGIGFGKNTRQNLEAIRRLSFLWEGDYAMLVGASRKRFIGEIAVQPVPDQRVAGTVAAHVLSIAGGADIIRVHDVAEAVQSARVADAILRA